MATPVHEVRSLFKKHKVVTFSGNFALYGDFSQRVVRLLQSEVPNVEVYSVDESFLEISGLDIQNYTVWAKNLRHKVGKYLGIPVSIGVAPTKTLAKAAAWQAKKDLKLGGVFSVVNDESPRIDLLKNMPVEEVWGVGRRTAPKLKNRGISSAWNLTEVSDVWARQQLTIKGLNTIKELRGERCSDLEEDKKPQQTLMVTRTFPTKIQAYYKLESAVATYAAKAAHKIRKFNQITSAVNVFIAGDRYGDKANYRRLSGRVMLEQPANDTATIIKSALKVLDQIYDADFSYKRAGVILGDLTSADNLQLSWTSEISPGKIDEAKELMKSVDAINKKYRTRLVRYAVEHSAESHHGKLRSPAYTTKWDSLPKVQ